LPIWVPSIAPQLVWPSTTMSFAPTRHYFVDGATLGGLTYEALERFEDGLNRKTRPPRCA